MFVQPGDAAFNTLCFIWCGVFQVLVFCHTNTFACSPELHFGVIGNRTPSSTLSQKFISNVIYN